MLVPHPDASAKECSPRKEHSAEASGVLQRPSGGAADVKAHIQSLRFMQSLLVQYSLFTIHAFLHVRQPAALQTAHPV
jgi:hypothetical protein